MIVDAAFQLRRARDAILSVDELGSVGESTVITGIKSKSNLVSQDGRIEVSDAAVTDQDLRARIGCTKHSHQQRDQ